MPLYTYINPETEETIDIIQSINDKHIYIDKHGLEWKRVFTVPEVNTQGTLRADCSSREFSEFTKNKRGSLGDMFDRSAELSEKRKKMYGKDPVKEKYFKDWSKKRKGKIHPKGRSD